MTVIFKLVLWCIGLVFMAIFAGWIWLTTLAAKSIDTANNKSVTISIAQVHCNKISNATPLTVVESIKE